MSLTITVYRLRGSVAGVAERVRPRGAMLCYNHNTIAERRIKGESTMDKKGMTAGTEVIPEKDKAAAKEAAAEEKKKVECVEEVAAVPKAPKQDPAPEIIFQYREYEASMDVVTDRVKAHYYAKGHAQGSIESIQIYVKPEDFTAYYVINDGIVGKVNLF